MRVIYWRHFQLRVVVFSVPGWHHLNLLSLHQPFGWKFMYLYFDCLLLWEVCCGDLQLEGSDFLRWVPPLWSMTKWEALRPLILHLPFLPRPLIAIRWLSIWPALHRAPNLVNSWRLYHGTYYIIVHWLLPLVLLVHIQSTEHVLADLYRARFLQDRAEIDIADRRFWWWWLWMGHSLVADFFSA